MELFHLHLVIIYYDNVKNLIHIDRYLFMEIILHLLLYYKYNLFFYF
jgi:hypothetical protein